jgi:sugar O-acyltransferase (sialic acid O-acetyltransferase NeuD family)
MKRALYAIYGASGCGRGVMPLAAAMLQGECGGPADGELVFVDDAPQARIVNERRVLTYREFLDEPAAARHVCLAIADSRIRARLAERCRQDGIASFAVKAGNVIVMDQVSLGEGAILSPFVTLTSNIRIGRHFHCNLYSYVEHDCVIGDFVTFGPGVHCNGNVHIEDHAYLGAGCVLKQGTPDAPLIIGAGAIVGMGAVVTRSVAPGTTVVGNPARAMKQEQADDRC